MIYPRWAPIELCNYHREWELKGEPEVLCQEFIDLESLINPANKKMAAVWRDLERLAAAKGINHYAMGLYAALCPDGPQGTDKLTKAELEETIHEIKQLSSRLAGMIDRVMPMVSISAVLRDRPTTAHKYIPVFDVVRDLGGYADTLLKEPRLLDRTSGNNVRTRYFVRTLCKHFNDKYGEIPYSAIAKITSTILDIDNIDARKIKSLLRGVKL